MASHMVGHTAHRFSWNPINSSVLTSEHEESEEDGKWLGNDTIDVVQMGCSANFNTVACIRLDSIYSQVLFMYIYYDNNVLIDFCIILLDFTSE